MKIDIEQTFKFNLTLNTKYCILNKLNPTYGGVEHKALFRTKDLNELVTITPDHDVRHTLGLSPYVNQLTYCFVQFKPGCRLIRFKPNLITKDVTTVTAYRKFDNVLGNSNYKTSFTQIKQEQMATLKLRTFLIPTTKIKETIRDIQRDLFLAKI